MGRLNLFKTSGIIVVITLLCIFKTAIADNSINFGNIPTKAVVENNENGDETSDTSAKTTKRKTGKGATVRYLKSYNQPLQNPTNPSTKKWPNAACDDGRATAAAKKLGMRETFAYCVYCQIVDDNGGYTQQKHYVWNPLKQNFEYLPNLYFIPKKGINDSRVQANIQGYGFTNTNGVYSKNGKLYKYNPSKWNFVEK